MSNPSHEATGSRRSSPPDPVPPKVKSALLEIERARKELDLAEVELLDTEPGYDNFTRGIDHMFRACAHTVRGISFASANGAAQAALAAVKKQFNKVDSRDPFLPRGHAGPDVGGAA